MVLGFCSIQPSISLFLYFIFKSNASFFSAPSSHIVYSPNFCTDPLSRHNSERSLCLKKMLHMKKLYQIVRRRLMIRCMKLNCFAVNSRSGPALFGIFFILELTVHAVIINASVLTAIPIREIWCQFNICMWIHVIWCFKHKCFRFNVIKNSLDHGKELESACNSIYSVIIQS